MMCAKFTACLAVRPEKQYDVGAGQGGQMLIQVLALCPFSPHPEQVLRCFFALTTLGSLKMFMLPARPSRGLETFFALTGGSIAPSSAATRFSAGEMAIIAPSSAATRFSAGEMVVRNWQVVLL